VTSVRPGTPAKVQVWRDGKTIDLSVKLDEFKDTTRVAAADDASGDKDAPAKAEAASDTRLGLKLRPLNAKERAAAKVAHGGAVIADLSERSTVEALTPGDIVISVMRKGKSSAVNGPGQLAELIKGADKGSTIAFRVKRPTDRAGGEYAELFVPEKVPE